MTSILAALGCLIVIGGGVLWWMRRERKAGADAAQLEQRERDIAARSRVAQAGAGPRGPEQVEDALRRGGF